MGETQTKITVEEKNSLLQRKHGDILESRRFRNFSTLKDKCLQIDKSSLAPNTPIRFNLFKQLGMNIKFIAKAEEESPFIIKDCLLRRVDDPRCSILIERAAIPVYKRYLLSMSDAPGLSTKERYERNILVFKENTKILMKELLENPRSGAQMKEAKKAVDTIIALLVDKKVALRKMLTLSRCDHYTYTHCLNVATLSIGLGLELKLSKQDVRTLGIGAMMHDLGKSKMPSEILNKQGKLNELEYRLIQGHVRMGAEILKSNKDFPEEAFPVVLQHHEKLNGKGYPYKLRGDNIKLFGRICAIADSYDALTTGRAYKKAFKPYDALTIISRQTAHYDADILKLFVKMLGKVRN